MLFIKTLLFNVKLNKMRLLEHLNFISTWWYVVIIVLKMLYIVFNLEEVKIITIINYFGNSINENELLYHVPENVDIV